MSILPHLARQADIPWRKMRHPKATTHNAPLVRVMLLSGLSCLSCPSFGASVDVSTVEGGGGMRGSLSLGAAPS